MSRVAPPPGEPTFQFLCPRCREVFVYAVADIPPKGIQLRCPGCELAFRRTLSRPEPDASIGGCWLCGTRELYVQKDLNWAFATLAVLISMCMVVLLALLTDLTLGVLALVLIGVAFASFYALLSRCTVCYICGSIYRGFPIDPRHPGYFPGYEERYRDRKSGWLARVLEQDHGEETGPGGEMAPGRVMGPGKATGQGEETGRGEKAGQGEAASPGEKATASA